MLRIQIALASGAVVLVLALFTSVSGSPNGSPVKACYNDRPNQPYHGQIRPQSPSTNPYQILASSSQYSPGKQIRVAIRGEPFKGFFIQARDVKTNQWIGRFALTSNTKVHDECSAVTHTDPRDKKEATLIWNAPISGQGQVYFTGSVLKDYDVFWADLVSQ